MVSGFKGFMSVLLGIAFWVSGGEVHAAPMDSLQVNTRSRQEEGVLDIRIMLGAFDYQVKDEQITHYDNARIYYELWMALKNLGYEDGTVNSAEFGLPSDYKPSVENQMFTKWITPWSGEGTIRVTVMNSIMYSTQTEIDQNREAQTKQSQMAQLFAQNAVKDGDGFIYLGHSRNGGGPDPFEPILLENRHTNYDHYEAKKPGLKALEPYLKASTKSPVLIGSFSCSSVKHFQKYFEKNLAGKNETQFVGTRDLLYFTENIPMITELLTGITHGDSEEEIARRMNLHQVDIKGEDGKSRQENIMKFVPINPGK